MNTYLNSDKQEKVKLVLFAVGLTVLLAIRDIGGISVNKYLYFAFAAACMLMARPDTLIDMLAFMFPLLWGLPSTYILLIAVVLYYIKCRRVTVLSLALVLIFALLEILAAVFYTTVSYLWIVQYICTIALFFSLLYDTQEMDCQKAVQWFFYGSSALCIIIVVSTLKSVSSDWLILLANGMLRFGNVQATEGGGMQLLVNANTLAYYSIVGITVGFVLYQKQTVRQRILTVLLVFVHLFTGMMTLSRSWALMLAGSLLLLLLHSTKSWKAVLTAIVVMAVSVYVVVAFLQRNPAVWEGFVSRFTDDTVDTGGGRGTIMRDYWAAFYSNVRYWFTGTGVTQYQAVLEKSASMHNAFQQLVICYGIPGTFLFLYGMLRPLKGIGKADLLHWIPVIATLSFVQTIQFINPYSLMFPYVAAVWALKCGKQHTVGADRLLADGKGNA